MTASVPVLDFRKTRFVSSAAAISQLPADSGAEIAFVGRSNSGKSSAINAICDQRTLAKTSRTPGRTRLINLFEAAPGCTLVDLPGYGYAAVSAATQRQWRETLTQYLRQRRALRGIVITMDIRTPLRDHDRLILDWTLAASLPALILLTKADKFGAQKRRETAGELRTALSEFGGSFAIIPFSALKKLGVDEARGILSQWFALFGGARNGAENA